MRKSNACFPHHSTCASASAPGSPPASPPRASPAPYFCNNSFDLLRFAFLRLLRHQRTDALQRGGLFSCCACRSLCFSVTFTVTDGCAFTVLSFVPTSALASPAGFRHDGETLPQSSLIHFPFTFLRFLKNDFLSLFPWRCDLRRHPFGGFPEHPHLVTEGEQLHPHSDAEPPFFLYPSFQKLRNKRCGANGQIPCSHAMRL